MHNSAAQPAPGASVEQPQITVAPNAFFVVLNDYQNSRYSVPQTQSSLFANHPAAQDSAARSRSPAFLPTGSPEAQPHTSPQAAITGHPDAASGILTALP